MPHLPWGLSDAVKAEIIAVRESGSSYAEIAHRFGVGKTVAQWVAMDSGVEFRPRKLTPEFIAAFIANVKDGVPLGTAATMAGVSRITFGCWWKHGQVEARGVCRDLVVAVREVIGESPRRSYAARTTTLDERFFGTIDTETKAYWLGFLAADGWVCDSEVGLKLASKDRGHLEKFREAIGSNGKIKDYAHPKTTVIRKRRRGPCIVNSGPKSEFRACSLQMAADLRAAGVVQRKSLILKPWPGPEHLVRHYWRGLFDGDGTIGTVKRTCRNRHVWSLGICGTLEVVTAFREFVSARVGRKGHLALNDGGPSFVVHWRGHRVVQAISHLLYDGASVALDRKLALAQQCMSIIARRDWSSVSADDLRRLVEQFGTWQAVADHLGLSRDHLVHLRRDRGIL